MHEWPNLSYWGIILLQLVVSTICGGIIGFQRELQDHPAGFRTHVLVCVGSTVYMLVSIAIAGNRYDPGRIAAQVASGIGFLGAGTIIKQGSIVRGLTTAASLWAVAGIGLAVGLGGQALIIAFLGTLVVFFALGGLLRLEQRIERGRPCQLQIILETPRERIAWIQQVLNSYNIETRNISISNEENGVGEVALEGRTVTLEQLEGAVSELTRDQAVRSVNWACR